MTGNFWQLQPGIAATVQSFDESMQQTQRQRLTELGFGLGAVVRCVVSPRFGAPRLYRGDGAVFSMEKSIAQQVLVSTDEGDL
ncbi:MAG: ferrous iron transport protein A [Gammaproteobacteria bacterium]|nr:MAG: ferrous iron transport protein A [Gammaproteobacteria bacterium]